MPVLLGGRQAGHIVCHNSEGWGAGTRWLAAGVGSRTAPHRGQRFDFHLHGLAGSYRSLTFSLFYNMKVTHLIKE